MVQHATTLGADRKCPPGRVRDELLSVAGRLARDGETPLKHSQGNPVRFTSGVAILMAEAPNRERFTGMNDVFILGAGFSKALYHKMPTMEELSSAVRTNLKAIRVPMPDALEKLGNNIELWMTYLSHAQPWIKPYENDLNKGFAGLLRDQIKRIIEAKTEAAARSSLPHWLIDLIKSWHRRRATIITLNYDTLVERASRDLQITDKIKGVHPSQMYPPYFANILARSGVAVWGGADITTFSYLKLHGSTNWYYSGRDNFYGETIFFGDVAPFCSDSLSLEEESVSMPYEDKQALIIPPVTEKTTYFNSETIRGLWHRAGVALSNATQVFVIGYSLPDSDVGMRLFLTGNQPTARTPFYVIDTNAEVTKRYESILPKMQIREEFARDQNPVEEFSKQYPRMIPR